MDNPATAADRLRGLEQRRAKLQGQVAELRTREHAISERLAVLIAEGDTDAPGVGDLRGERFDVREAVEDLDRVLPLIETQIEVARKAALADELGERRTAAQARREVATDALRAVLEASDHLANLWDAWREADTEHRAAISELRSTYHQLHGRVAHPGEAGVDPEAPLSDNGVIGNPWRGVRMQNVAGWKEQRRSWGA
jgi:chromosome segregation ATPase